LKTVLTVVRFLLAQLHLNSLVGTRSPKALRDTLIKLPQGSKAYEHAYANCIERIKGQTASAEELAMQALAWVVNAKRALTATELRHALAVELDELEFDEENLPDIDDTVSVCAGLLTFDEESSVVRVVHYTTQQYFEQTQNTWFPHAEAHIARICVTYLSFRVFESGFCRGDEEFEERLRLHPLYEYAAQNWGHHALKSLLQIDVRLSFLQSPTKVEASSQALFAKKRQWIRRYSQFVPRQITGLHLAAYFGLTELSSVLIASGQKIDQENEDGQAAISWAVQRGHTSLVQELLLQGADLRKRDKLGQSLLALAAIAGSEDVIKILLHAGLDGDLKDHNGRTPLSLAAEYGHLEVVKILLTMGKADPDLKNAYGRTPLFWAAKNGHEAIFSILLARGANPDSRDICEETPLWEAANGAHDRIVTLLLANPKVTQESREKYEATRLIREVRMGTEAGVMRLLSKVNPTLRKDAILESLEMASMRGDEAMFKRLLEEGAQYELRDEDTRISLIRAVECENEAIVRSLLERTQGVNVTDESQLGRPLLCLAIQIGNVPIASMLLNGGSDPNRGDGNNDTSLAYAAKYRRREILKLVLDGKDVDINSTNNQGDTPLLLAAKDGFKEILKPLLQAGAAIEAQDYQGRTALVWAATEGHIGALKLLLERGARCDIPDNLQRTPFSYAAENGHEDVVRILLDNNVEADSSCEDGKTPLSYVAANGHESIVQLLLVYCRVNLNSTDNKGWTPLMWAAEEGREAVLTLLTNAGADLNLTNTWGQTPTCRAAQRGHDEIVKFLLERNCLVQTIEDISGWTPLFEAIKEGRESTTELLLACPSVDFEHKDTNGRTPLSWAAESGREKIVEMLLQKENLIIDSRDNMGRTPLLWAARRGREAVTGLLLEANANVNSEDLQGGTPLKLAAQHGHDTVVALLLENGAEINHRNGWTALQCATIEGCVTVEQTLREAGALDSDDFFGIIGLFSDDS
jgi:ankyrin repeat protein